MQVAAWVTNTPGGFGTLDKDRAASPMQMGKTFICAQVGVGEISSLPAAATYMPVI